jgi:hypothetical protein
VYCLEVVVRALVCGGRVGVGRRVTSNGKHPRDVHRSQPERGVCDYIKVAAPPLAAVGIVRRLDLTPARLGSAARFRSHGVLDSSDEDLAVYSHQPTHHHERPIDSAFAHVLASMALTGSPCHYARLPGSTAATRRLLFHTRKPGARQEE